MSPVKNQGNCGSCSAFASIAAIEVCFNKNAAKAGEKFDLSEQELLDCTAGQGEFGGCDGNPINSFFEWATTTPEEHPLAIRSAYPYVASTTKGNCPIGALPEDKFVRDVQVNMTMYTYSGTEELLKTLVYEHGAAVVSVHAGGFENDISPGQVYEGCKPEDGKHRDHAVAVVGYGDGDQGPYWLIKNSWGTRWGDGGYIMMRRGVEMCGIGTHIAVVNCFSTAD